MSDPEPDRATIVAELREALGLAPYWGWDSRQRAGSHKPKRVLRQPSDWHGRRVHTLDQPPQDE